MAEFGVLLFTVLLIAEVYIFFIGNINDDGTRKVYESYFVSGSLILTLMLLGMSLINVFYEKPESEPCESYDCQADMLYLSAEIYCPDQIEMLTDYQVKWGEGSLFSRVSTEPVQGGAYFSGDNALVQNEYGAWIKHQYSCVIDLETEDVTYTFLNRGRLPELAE